MDVSKTNNNEKLKFPRSVFVIFLIHFVSKFSQSTFRGTLPLYFVEKLKFNESDATVTFHILMVILHISALAGGLLADSFFGKYKVLLSSLFLSALSLIILTVALITPLNVPINEMTFFSLFFGHVGFGAYIPCMYSFGGDQFVMPQQEKQLSLFFVLICTVMHIGSLLTFFISPILRKDVRCFGELHCYSLVFAVPTCLIIIAFVTLLATKMIYRIQKSEGNVVVAKIVRCASYALSKKFKSKEIKKHWLNYASDKYKTAFIEDIKSVFGICKMLMPLVILFALSAADATTMTFQASRMDGEVFGYLIKPDQIHVVYAFLGIVGLPAIHYYVYPLLATFFRLNTPLKRLILSFCVAALSYYIATIVEWKLENTYAPSPTTGNAHLRIYNTVNCKTIMIMNEKKIEIGKLGMWENLDIAVTGKKLFHYSINFEQCNSPELSSNLSGNFEVQEKQAISFALTENSLSYKFIDHNDKSASGNPLVRALVHRNTNGSENQIALMIKMKEEILSKIPIHKSIKKSEFFEVVHGTYDIYLDDQKMLSEIPLKIGGVYTFLGHISNSSEMINIVTVTAPNSMHLLWALPQQILLALALITVDAVGMEFVYSQAPLSMKASMQSYADVSVGFGHLIVAMITYANFFDRKVFVFLLYAVLMTIATIIFALQAKSYKYRQTRKTTCEQTTESLTNNIVEQNLE